MAVIGPFLIGNDTPTFLEKTNGIKNLEEKKVLPKTGHKIQTTENILQNNTEIPQFFVIKENVPKSTGIQNAASTAQVGNELHLISAVLRRKLGGIDEFPAQSCMPPFLGEIPEKYHTFATSWIPPKKMVIE